MSENDSYPSQTDKQGSQTANGQGLEKPTDEQEAATPFTKWPWPAQFAFALFILVAVTTLLVGLPVASMLIVERMSPGSLVGTVSFWGASFAGFISLAVIFIGSVFAFTALKVETNAQKQMEQALWDAQKEALQVANEQVPKLLKDVEEKALDEVRKQGEDAVEQVNKERQKTLTEIREAADESINRNAHAYVQERGEEITKTAADKYMDEHGTGIAKTAADEYMDEHGTGISENAASRFLRENGEKTIKKTVLEYIENIKNNVGAATADDPNQRKLITRLKTFFGLGRNIKD